VNSSDSSVQEHGCWALCALSRHHAANAKLMMQGLDRAVPQAIKFAMDGHLSNVPLQEKGCAALRALCDGDLENVDILLQEGLLTSLHSVMVAQPAAAAVQRQWCGTVSTIAASPEVREALCEQGFVELVHGALHNHIDSTGVVEQALAALTNIALDPKGRVLIADQGCIDETREVMFKHKYHPGLQTNCCDLLASLAVSPENQGRIVADGGMDLILEAMRNFSGAPVLQRHATIALAALVNNHVENKMYSTTQGVFAMLRTACTNHKGDATVAEAVCRFVLYFMIDKMLVRGTTFKALIVNEGFVEQICECMKNCVSTAPVQIWACRAMHQLASRSSEHKSTLATSGVISLLCSAMGHHPTDSEVLTQVVAVMLSLSVERALQPVLVKQGAVPLLRDAMRVHAQHVKLQEDCIWTLLNIAWTDIACRTAVREAGVIPFIVEARIRHKSSGSTVLDAKARDLLDKIDSGGQGAAVGAAGIYVDM